MRGGRGFAFVCLRECVVHSHGGKALMITPQDDVHELQMKIANYRRTLATVAPSMRRWCDTLIRETEEQLRQLTQPDGAGSVRGLTTAPPRCRWTAGEVPWPEGRVRISG